MVRCNSCGRLWPEGSRYCGHCQATLGVVVCKDGHESPLGSTCCTICGSKQLSKGTPAIQLRTATRIVVILALVGVVLLLLGPVRALLWSLFCSLINLVAPPLVTMAMLSIVLSAMVGEKGRKLIAAFWYGLGAILLWSLRGVVKIVSGLLRLGPKVP